MGPGWDPGEAVHSDLPCWQCLWEAILYDAGMLPWRSLWEAASRVSLVKPFPWEYWLAAFSGTATQEDAWRSHSQLESCWWLFTKKLLKRQLEKVPLGIAPGWCCLRVVLLEPRAAEATMLLESVHGSTSEPGRETPSSSVPSTPPTDRAEHRAGCKGETFAGSYRWNSNFR